MRFIFLLSLVLSLQLHAKDISLPKLTSPVMDLAGFLSPEQEKALSSLSREIYQAKGPQITILTVTDLQGLEIEDFSIRVAEKWQLGSKERDNGLIVLISKKERRMRIEVGGGLEGEITDYYTAQYTRQIFPTYFKRGEFYQGLMIFLQDIAQKFNIPVSGRKFVRRTQGSGNIGLLEKLILSLGVIFILGSLFFKGRPVARSITTAFGFTLISFLLGASLLFILSAFFFGLLLGIVGLGNFLTALAYSRGGFGGGFGGGGGWSGGGGGFSGGGSSGSW